MTGWPAEARRGGGSGLDGRIETGYLEDHGPHAGSTSPSDQGGNPHRRIGLPCDPRATTVASSSSKSPGTVANDHGSEVRLPRRRHPLVTTSSPPCDVTKVASQSQSGLHRPARCSPPVDPPLARPPKRDHRNNPSATPPPSKHQAQVLLNDHRADATETSPPRAAAIDFATTASLKSSNAHPEILA